MNQEDEIAKELEEIVFDDDEMSMDIFDRNILPTMCTIAENVAVILRNFHRIGGEYMKNVKIWNAKWNEMCIEMMRAVKNDIDLIDETAKEGKYLLWAMSEMQMDIANLMEDWDWSEYERLEEKEWEDFFLKGIQKRVENVNWLAFLPVE